MNEKSDQIVSDACIIVRTIIYHLNEKECNHKIKDILQEALLDDKQKGWNDFQTSPTSTAPTERSQSITGNVLTPND